MNELRIKVKGGLELGLNLGKGEKWGDGTKARGEGEELLPAVTFRPQRKFNLKKAE
jgi:hypothetical protein